MKKKLIIIVIWVFILSCYAGTPEKEIRINNIQEEVSNTSNNEEISIIMVGDILLHENISNSGKINDSTYNYDHIFAMVRKDIEAADLAIVNQEVILGGRELGISGYPVFNGAYEVGDAITTAGFDVVLHATNHALDKGKKGINNCLQYWRTNHNEIAVLGIYDNQNDYDRNRYIYEKDGMRIAILNYTYGTNGIPLPEDMPFAVSMLNTEKIITDLANAKKEADFIIVCPHWGTEYMHTPSDEQKKWTKLMVENGADLIIGTHPHVIQPVEWFEDEKDNKALVYYSIGNFINANMTPNRMIGAMAKVTLTRDDNGTVVIKDYEVEPVVTHFRYGPKNATTYKLKDYTDALAAMNETKKKDSTFCLQYCKDLCHEIFGDLSPLY